MSADYVRESVAAIESATNYGELDQIFATRIHALINDGGTLAQLRTVANAWDRRRKQLLQADLGQDGDNG